jgi:tRNA pseudouridine55 synthase
MELQLDGLIVLDKPAGITSAAAVSRVKRLLPRGVKVGHAGTLDPFATGVLLVLVGRGTKSSQRLMDQAKQYDATIKLGASTATDDLDSPEIPCASAAAVALEQIETACRAFSGVISQRPPSFSALKLGGQPAYKLARKGQTPELAAREVRIDRFEILSWEHPLLKVSIGCGRGTYIRAIARDLGEMLGTGGYLTELRRTGIGDFDVASAVTLDRLQSEGITQHLRKLG